MSTFSCWSDAVGVRIRKNIIRQISAYAQYITDMFCNVAMTRNPIHAFISNVNEIHVHVILEMFRYLHLRM